MIIDDEMDIRIYLMAALEDRGYNTCTIEDDEAVLEVVRKEKPDLIVLDIMMPMRSGISIFKDLRTDPGTLPIPIALISGLETSKGMLTDELIDLIDEKIIELPDGFIEKPVRLNDFLNLVAQLS
jgi:CheY-like chemotaxis protein